MCFPLLTSQSPRIYRTLSSSFNTLQITMPATFEFLCDAIRSTVIADILEFFDGVALQSRHCTGSIMEYKIVQLTWQASTKHGAVVGLTYARSSSSSSLRTPQGAVIDYTSSRYDCSIFTVASYKIAGANV